MSHLNSEDDFIEVLTLAGESANALVRSFDARDVPYQMQILILSGALACLIQSDRDRAAMNDAIDLFTESRVEVA